MSKCALLILLSLPNVICAQLAQSSNAIADSGVSASATHETNTPPSNPQSAGPAHRGYFNGDMFFGERTVGSNQSQVGSFTAGYIYTFTDSQHGHNRSLMGWSAVPEVRLFRMIGLQADFSGLYVRSVYPGENRFVAAAGPRYTFAPRSRFTPFVYAEGGEMRSTSQANHLSDWNTVVKGGVGLERKVAGGIAFQMIPGEYVGEQLDDHSWEHSYSARAGITFNLYR